MQPNPNSRKNDRTKHINIAQMASMLHTFNVQVVAVGNTFNVQVVAVGSMTKKTCSGLRILVFGPATGLSCRKLPCEGSPLVI